MTVEQTTIAAAVMSLAGSGVMALVTCAAWAEIRTLRAELNTLQAEVRATIAASDPKAVAEAGRRGITTRANGWQAADRRPSSGSHSG